MKPLQTLDDVFQGELNDIYSAELMVKDAMPKMINAASSKQLKNKFQQHLKQTERQIDRLEDVFDMLDLEIEVEECEGMKGILKDGEKIIKAEGEPNAKDAALIAAAQKVEHYEIASYGTLREFAQTLGYDDAAKKLETTLKEEYKTDDLLTNLAESSFNIRAAE